MRVQINITGLSEEEKAAREILEHIEAIRKIQRESTWNALEVRVDVKDETASSN